MKCRHDLTYLDEDYYDLPDCDVHVNCDANCKALTDPQTIDELRAAVEHWRSHSWLAGCSHAG